MICEVNTPQNNHFEKFQNIYRSWNYFCYIYLKYSRISTHSKLYFLLCKSLKNDIKMSLSFLAFSLRDILSLISSSTSSRELYCRKTGLSLNWCPTAISQKKGGSHMERGPFSWRTFAFIGFTGHCLIISFILIFLIVIRCNFHDYASVLFILFSSVNVSSDLLTRQYIVGIFSGV